MTPIKELRKLCANAISSSKFNTNNGWGFGGSYGIAYQLNNGVTISYVNVCYRHMTPDRYIWAKDKDGNDIFYTKRPTVNQLNKLKKQL